MTIERPSNPCAIRSPNGCVGSSILKAAARPSTIPRKKSRAILPATLNGISIKARARVTYAGQTLPTLWPMQCGTFTKADMCSTSGLSCRITFTSSFGRCRIICLSDILKSWKQFTSRRAKKILHLGEEPFWQPESYDHWIRNDEERARIVRYIRNNPVTAGLCARPEDWKWSSAYGPML